MMKMITKRKRRNRVLEKISNRHNIRDLLCKFSE